MPHSPKNRSQKEGWEQRTAQSVSRGEGESRLLRIYDQDHPLELKSLLNLSPLPSYPAFCLHRRESLETLKTSIGNSPSSAAISFRAPNAAPFQMASSTRLPWRLQARDTYCPYIKASKTSPTRGVHKMSSVCQQGLEIKFQKS